MAVRSAVVICLTSSTDTQICPLECHLESWKEPEVAQRSFQENMLIVSRLQFGWSPISAALWGKYDKAVCDRARWDCFSMFPTYFTEWHPWNFSEIWYKYRYIQITWYLSFLTLHTAEVGRFRTLLGSCWRGQATLYLFQKLLCWAYKYIVCHNEILSSGVKLCVFY